MTELRLTETKTTEFIERSGTPQELYALLKENDLVKGSYEQFLYKLTLQLTQSPCMGMRLSVITKDQKHIRFTIDSLEVAEALEDEFVGLDVTSTLKSQKSWREFRKEQRRRERKSN